MYKKYVTFSFDDGLEQDKKLTALMKKYGLKGTFNLNSGLMGKRQLVAGIGTLGFMETPEDVERKNWLTYVPQFRIPEDEIAQVYDGFEVASHGYRHEPLAFLPEDKMKESLNLDLEHLESLVGYRIYGHAFAKGMGTKAVRDYLRMKGVIYTRGIITTRRFDFPKDPLKYNPTCSQINKHVFDIIDRFLDTDPVDDDMLLYIWGHGYECDFNEKEASWEKTEKIFQKLSGIEGLTYCTNLEAFLDHAAQQ